MLKTLVRNYPQVHLGLGLFGNTLFFVGSVLFFKTFEAWHRLAVWLFVIGSLGMLLGAIGKAARDIYQAAEQQSAPEQAHRG